MTCDELRPDYIPYALGTLSDPEQSELKAHVERGCQQCAAGLREARLFAFTIAAELDGPEPPRRLRNRILAAAGAKSTSDRNWFPAWLATACAAALLVALTTGLYLAQRNRSTEQLADLRGQLERNRIEAAAMRQALSLIQSPDTREVSFGQGKPLAPPRGRVFFHPSGILLVAANLAPPPPGKTYEMWIIRGGKPAPAGLFASDPQGNAVHLYSTPVPAGASDVVAVTLEASAGAAQPTSTPVIVAPLNL